MKILSRKVIASLIVFITATLLLWYSKMDGYNWVLLSVGTLVGYLAGEGAGYLVYYLKDNKGCNAPALKAANRDAGLSFWAALMLRIRNLFSPSFIAAMLIYAVGTLMLWHGKINTTEWVYIALGMVVGYDVLNPLEKLR